MKVISTNISQPKKIKQGNKEVLTGIYKTSIVEGIFLESTDVKNDSVIDRKFHGGIDKACYLYSSEHYPFWKEQYPDLDWHWGMFGENLTVSNLDEKNIFIGDTIEIGQAIIQVSEPRRPCLTLAARFNDKSLVKKFLNSSYPGVYVRVLQNGLVKPQDKLKLISSSEENLSIEEVYSIFSRNSQNQQLIQKALNHPLLSKNCKNSIEKRLT